MSTTTLQESLRMITLQSHRKNNTLLSVGVDIRYTSDSVCITHWSVPVLEYAPHGSVVAVLASECGEYFIVLDGLGGFLYRRGYGAPVRLSYEWHDILLKFMSDRIAAGDILDAGLDVVSSVYGSPVVRFSLMPVMDDMLSIYFDSDLLCGVQHVGFH